MISIIRRYQAYKARKRKQREEIQRSDGYGLVMTEYFRNGKPLAEIETIVYSLSSWGEPISEAEMGMRTGIHDLRKFEKSVDRTMEAIELTIEHRAPGKPIFDRYGKRWRDELHHIKDSLKGFTNEH